MAKYQQFLSKTKHECKDTLQSTWLLENVWISEPSFLSTVEKFQRSLALPNMKYDCVVLFLESTVQVGNA